MKTIIPAVLAGLIVSATFASAFDNGQYGDVPAHIRKWFEGVRNRHGGICCDMADGHLTDYEERSDGYWVPIAGEMRHVPAEAVVRDAGNPVGGAVVWYVRQGSNTYFIRCFVPGGGV